MTTDPARFDVIVTDNLFGDIITDLAAAITGGIGLAASGQHQPGPHRARRMFEPVHGSAPDIAGQQKADPTAAILSASLLLDHLGLRRRRRAPSRRAVVADLADRAPGHHAPYLRGRRRDRRASSRLSRAASPATANPDLQACPDSPGLPTGRATVPPHGQIAADRHASAPPDQPVDDARLAEILANPGFGAALHRPHVHGRVDARRRAGTTPGSRRTARSPSTRRPRCCTTRRRSSRA